MGSCWVWGQYKMNIKTNSLQYYIDKLKSDKKAFDLWKEYKNRMDNGKGE